MFQINSPYPQRAHGPDRRQICNQIIANKLLSVILEKRRVQWRLKEGKDELHGGVDKKDFTEGMAMRGHLKDGQKFPRGLEGRGHYKQRERVQSHRSVEQHGRFGKGQDFGMMAQWVGA